jgi:hypothetical protein
MKYLIFVFAGLVIGFSVAKIGPHTIIGKTSDGIKATSKALDSVNKNIK